MRKVLVPEVGELDPAGKYYTCIKLQTQNHFWLRQADKDCADTWDKTEQGGHRSDSTTCLIAR